MNNKNIQEIIGYMCFSLCLVLLAIGFIGYKINSNLKGIQENTKTLNCKIFNDTRIAFKLCMLDK